jgi:hypothetical protein
MKDWVTRGACFLFCPSFTRKHNFGRPVNLLVRSFKQNLSTKVKLLVGFYQISTLLHSSYNVPYPYTYLHVMGKLQFISVDFTRALPGPCIFGSDYDFASKLYTMVGFAVAICLGSWKLAKYASGESLESPRPSAKKAVSWLPTVVFLAYPGFSSFFFDALHCREIDGMNYLVTDLSIACSGADYNVLRAIAIVCVVFWCFGLPVIAMALLWPERSNLLQGHKPSGGLSEHLHDFYAPYKPRYWFFESLEFAKKLLLIGVVPWASGDIAGAVIALLVTGVYILLITAHTPYAHKSDHFVAICSNVLLFIVILLSVLLKMNAAYTANLAADGLDPNTVSKLLVASNVLVVVVSVAAFVISDRQAAPDEPSNYRGSSDKQGFDSLTTRHDDSSLQEPLLHPLEVEVGNTNNYMGDEEPSLLTVPSSTSTADEESGIDRPHDELRAKSARGPRGDF